MIPSKESLLQSIQPWMRLSKSLFLKIYGYELSYPGFAEQAISALESAGCNMARQYYNQSVLEYEQKKDEDLKPVAAWYDKQCVEKYERKEAIRKNGSGSGKYSKYQFAGFPEDW